MYKNLNEVNDNGSSSKLNLGYNMKILLMFFLSIVGFLPFVGAQESVSLIESFKKILFDPSSQYSSYFRLQEIVPVPGGRTGYDLPPNYISYEEVRGIIYVRNENITAGSVEDNTVDNTNGDRAVALIDQVVNRAIHEKKLNSILELIDVILHSDPQFYRYADALIDKLFNSFKNDSEKLSMFLNPVLSDNRVFWNIDPMKERLWPFLNLEQKRILFLSFLSNNYKGQGNHIYKLLAGPVARPTEYNRILNLERLLLKYVENEKMRSYELYSDQMAKDFVEIMSKHSFPFLRDDAFWRKYLVSIFIFFKKVVLEQNDPVLRTAFLKSEVLDVFKHLYGDSKFLDIAMELYSQIDSTGVIEGRILMEYFQLQVNYFTIPPRFRDYVNSIERKGNYEAIYNLLKMMKAKRFGSEVTRAEIEWLQKIADRNGRVGGLRCSAFFLK